MFKKIKGFIDTNKTKIMAASCSAVTAFSAVGIQSFAQVSNPSGGSSWVGSIDVSPIVDNITAAVPVVLPALISILAIRKGVSFVIGTIRRG